MTAKPDHQASLDFLRKLYPQGPWTITAIHPDKVNSSTGDAETRTRTFTEERMILGFLDQHREWNLYYSVNPTVGKVEKKPERHEIAALCYLHVDMDRRADETMTQAWERIRATLSLPPGGLPPPTGLVASGGGGANAAWAIEVPVQIQGVSPAERLAHAIEIAGYSRQIELIVGGADACHNVDRILRLPGTLNWPNAAKRLKYGRNEPTLARLDFWRPERVYPISAFVCAPSTVAAKAIKGGPTRHGYSAGGNIERVVDVEALDLSKLRAMGRDADAVRLTISTGQPPPEFAAKWGGDRSKMVLWVCCELVRAGVPDSKIYGIITDPALPVSGHVLDQRSNVKRYAERQIDRAHDMAIHEDLVWVNEMYAAIEDAGGKCAVIKEVDGKELTFFSPASFREFHSNRFVEVTKKDKKGNLQTESVALGPWWWYHPQRRSFEGMEFNPERTTPGYYNLWRGFAYDPVPGDWSLFRELVLNNLCRGNEAYYDYLIKWTAYAFQHPAQQGHTGVVLQGAMGTGKGTFGHTIGSLWGRHYYHLLDSNHLTGQFTGHLRDKIWVFADEAFFAGDYRNIAKIQGLITEPTLSIEDKYLKIQVVPNYLKLLVASNKKWVVNAAQTDRRWLVLETATLEQRAAERQRIAVDRQLDAGGRAGLLYDLLHMDLSDFNIRAIPQTEALATQKELSLSPEQTWWMNKLYAGELVGESPWDKSVPIRLMVDDYYNYHQRSRTRSNPLPDSQLGRFIQEVLPASPHSLVVRVGGRNHYRFPPLKACREHWDRMFNTHFPWPPINERPDAAGEIQTSFEGDRPPAEPEF